MRIERDDYTDNMADRGKIAIYNGGGYPDMHVTLEELIELHAEIGKYLLKRTLKMGSDL